MTKPEIIVGIEVKATDGEYKGLHGIVTLRGETLASVKFHWKEDTVYIGHLTTETDPIEGREILTKGQKQYTSCVIGITDDPIADLKKVRWEWAQDLAKTTDLKESNRIRQILEKFNREIETYEAAKHLGISHYDYMVWLNEAERLQRIKSSEYKKHLEKLGLIEKQTT